MAEINLITGCANGKVGNLQFQSQGLKCVVRSKQPSGLYNSQALDINAPVLKALSAQYHLWARYMLNNFKTDYAKPQAVWNYYTECNKRFYDNPESEFIGQCVNKGEYPLLPNCLLKIGDTKEETTFEWKGEVPSFYRDMQVLIFVWKQAGNIQDADKHLIDVSESPVLVPIENYDENDYCMAFIVVATDEGYELITGASVATIEVPQEKFWNIPADIATSLAKINYNSIGYQGNLNTMTVNLNDIPQEFQKYGVQIEWKKDFNVYTAGQIVAAPLMASYSYGWRDITYAKDDVIGIARLWDLQENVPRSSDIEVKSNLQLMPRSYYGIYDTTDPLKFDETSPIKMMSGGMWRDASTNPDGNYEARIVVEKGDFGEPLPINQNQQWNMLTRVMCSKGAEESINNFGYITVIDSRTKVEVSERLSIDYKYEQTLKYNITKNNFDAYARYYNLMTDNIELGIEPYFRGIALASGEVLQVTVKTDVFVAGVTNKSFEIDRPQDEIIIGDGGNYDCQVSFDEQVFSFCIINKNTKKKLSNDVEFTMQEMWASDDGTIIGMNFDIEIIFENVGGTCRATVGLGRDGDYGNWATNCTVALYTNGDVRYGGVAREVGTAPMKGQYGEVVLTAVGTQRMNVPLPTTKVAVITISKGNVIFAPYFTIE